MNKTYILVILTLVASALLASAFALLTAQLRLPGTGSIKGVGIGIYWDSECTNEASSLDFGLLEPASSKNFTLYLRNEGNSAVILNMTSENWIPTTAPDYLTLTWNLEGQQISPNSVMGFMIALHVEENVPAITFSLDIIISGTG